MELKDSELKYLERLASVKLGEEPRVKLKLQLSRIIDFVRRLQEVDTSDHAPRAYIGAFKPYMRDDSTGPCLPREEVLAESPDRENGFFRVPPIIETDDP